MPSEAAEILRIHISESDRHAGKPLFEALIAKCRELGIAGATVFQGVEGYGETAEMHKAHLAHSNRPIVVVVVDTAGNIERLIAAAAGMMDTGMMAKSAVEMIRVHKSGE